MPLRTLSDREVVARFGDPSLYLDAHGAAGVSWEANILASFPLPEPIPLSWGTARAARVRCHKAVLASLQDVFEELHRNPAAWASLDDFGGCYQWRKLTGDKSRLSRHCWGIAVDIDVADNAYGTGGEMHQYVIDTFEKHGWIWGGRFKKPDPMHFEIGEQT